MKIYLVTTAFFFSVALVAQTILPRFTEITYTGSGCPLDSVQITESADEASFSLLFNAFSIENASVFSTVRDCTITADIDVPFDFAVSVRPTSFLVKHTLTGASVGRLSLDTILGGRKRNDAVDLIREGIGAVGSGKMAWTNCGQDVQLRYFVKLIARKASNRDIAKASVTNSQSIELLWRSCR